MSEFNSQSGNVQPDGAQPNSTQPNNAQSSNATYGTQQQQAQYQQQYQQQSFGQQPPFTQQPQYSSSPQQPKIGEAFFNRIRSFGVYRGTDRWIGGVASGIAHRLGWDPLAIRIIILALTIIGGSGILLYAVAWLLLPDQRDGSILVQDALFYGKLSGSFWVALLFLIIGCPGTIALFPVVAVAVVALIIAWIIYTNRQNRQRSGWQPPYQQAPAQTQTGSSQSANGYTYQQPAFNQANPPYHTPYSTPYRTPYQANTAAMPEQVVRVRKPAGPTIVGITAGLLFISLAALIGVITFSGMITNTHDAMLAVFIWIFAATAVLGIITIATGITGRKSGGLIPITIVALIIACLALPAVPINQAWRNLTTSDSNAINITSSYRSFGSKDAERLMNHGLQLRAGSADINFTDWNDNHTSACPTGTLNVDAVASEITITIPDTCTASNEAHLVFASSSLGDDWNAGFYDGEPTTDPNSLVITGDAVMSVIDVQYVGVGSSDDDIQDL